MATTYPASIDGYTRPSGASGFNDASATDGTVFADNVYDAVEALETKVGVDASAVATTLDYLVKHGVTPADMLQTGKVTATIATSQNNYNPGGLASASLLMLTASASLLSLTGLAGGVEGRLMWIMNAGASNTITLQNESASSTTTNRFNGGADVKLGSGSAALVRYDGVAGRWNILNAPGAGGAIIYVQGDMRVPTPAQPTSVANKDYVDVAVAAVPVAPDLTPYPVFIQYTAGAWPARSTATSSATKMVIWKGPAATPPSAGGAGAVNGVDIFIAES